MTADTTEQRRRSVLWRVRYTLIGCRRFWGGWRMVSVWWAWSCEWDQSDTTPAEAVDEDLRGILYGE